MQERKKLLSFVVVGGGPTGVEVAAEMYDMVYEDLTKLYPSLIKDVQISIIELMDHVLSTYDRKISIYTGEQFRRSGINLVLNSRVSSVRDGYVTVLDKANEASEIPFGACVWATGGCRGRSGLGVGSSVAIRGRCIVRSPSVLDVKPAPALFASSIVRVKPFYPQRRMTVLSQRCSTSGQQKCDATPVATQQLLHPFLRY